MPAEVIEHVHVLAAQGNTPAGIAFANQHGAPIEDGYPDNDSNNDDNDDDGVIAGVYDEKNEINYNENDQIAGQLNNEDDANDANEDNEDDDDDIHIANEDENNKIENETNIENGNDTKNEVKSDNDEAENNVESENDESDQAFALDKENDAELANRSITTSTKK
jgi:hypothetical protein